MPLSLAKITTPSKVQVFVQEEGLKIGPRGRVQPAKIAMEQLTKGERRFVRKQLDKIGRRDLSRASV